MQTALESTVPSPDMGCLMSGVPVPTHIWDVPASELPHSKQDTQKALEAEEAHTCISWVVLFHPKMKSHSCLCLQPSDTPGCRCRVTARPAGTFQVTCPGVGDGKEYLHH